MEEKHHGMRKVRVMHEKNSKGQTRSEGKAGAKAVAHGSLALSLGMDHPEEGQGGNIAVQMACEKTSQAAVSADAKPFHKT